MRVNLVILYTKLKITMPYLDLNQISLVEISDQLASQQFERLCSKAAPVVNPRSLCKLSGLFNELSETVIFRLFIQYRLLTAIEISKIINET